MTAAEIISEASLLTRQNSGGVPTATWLSFLNRVQRNLLRRDNWPEMMVQNATLSILANTSSYALPDDFSRILGSYMWYGAVAITGGYQNGTPIPIIKSGAGFGDANVQAFSMIAPTSGYPAAVLIRGSTAQFYPATLTGSILVTYGYYREPDDLALGDDIPVETLANTYIVMLAMEIARYLEQWDMVNSFKADARDEYHMALRTLLTK